MYIQQVNLAMMGPPPKSSTDRLLQKNSDSFIEYESEIEDIQITPVELAKPSAASISIKDAMA